MVALTNDQIRLFNDIRTRVPGALDAAIQQELFEVFDEFFKFTNVWMETQTFSVVANTTSYTITPTEPSAVINRLMYLYDGNGTPKFAMMQTPGTMVLQTNPTQNDNTWQLTIALTCVDPQDTNNNAAIPTWILTKYRQDFMDGVIGRLMSQQKKPYTNEKMSVYHLRRWRSAMSGARTEVQRANTYRRQAWFYPQAFRTGGQKFIGSEMTFF